MWRFKAFRVWSPRLVKERDDTYIYYLLHKYGFILACIFSFLFWISYVLNLSLNFYFFKIAVDKAIPFESAIRSYSFIVTPTLLLFLLPYGALLFVSNIDLDTIDLTAWNRNRDRLLRGSRQRALLVGIFALVAIIYTATLGSYVFVETEFVRPYHLQSSYHAFFVILVWNAFFLGACPYALFGVWVTFYQILTKRGPTFRRTLTPQRNRKEPP